MKVFLVGFPKAGTSTIHRALEKSGFRPVHWKAGDWIVGEVLYANMLAGRDIFQGLEQFDAITQPDYCAPLKGKNFWPQLDLAILRTIRAQHPSCRLILNTRRMGQHVRSLRKCFLARLNHCDMPGLPAGFGGEAEHVHRWVVGHYANLETWGMPVHPVKIDAPDAREQLARAVEREITWWGRENITEAA